MPDPRDLPLFRWGEELRQVRLSRRARRVRTWAAIAATLVILLLATLFWPPRPRLVWNVSASAPIGLYHVADPAGLQPGDRVVAWPPAGARRLAGARHYLPIDVPLIKRVAAAPGDRICAVGQSVFVNGELLARRKRVDGSGRTLPAWLGCKVLEKGQLFLLSPPSGSFDGRYFGVTKRDEVIGEARRIGWLDWLYGTR